MSEHFKIELEVRDYELDIQGIVNNAIYFSYLQHARHCFLKSRGLDFAELHHKTIDPVVVRAELDYLASLKSGDRFYVTVSLKRKGKLRLLFYQNIIKLPEEKLIMQAVITATCLYNGRPQIPEFVEKALFPEGD